MNTPFFWFWLIIMFVVSAILVVYDYCATGPQKKRNTNLLFVVMVVFTSVCVVAFLTITDFSEDDRRLLGLMLRALVGG